MARPSFTDVRRTLASISNSSTFSLEKIKEAGGVTKFLQKSFEDRLVDLPFNIEHYNGLVRGRTPLLCLFPHSLRCIYVGGLLSFQRIFSHFSLCFTKSDVLFRVEILLQYNGTCSFRDPASKYWLDCKGDSAVDRGIGLGC